LPLRWSLRTALMRWGSPGSARPALGLHRMQLPRGASHAPKAARQASALAARRRPVTPAAAAQRGARGSGGSPCGSSRPDLSRHLLSKASVANAGCAARRPARAKRLTKSLPWATSIERLPASLRTSAQARRQGLHRDWQPAALAPCAPNTPRPEQALPRLLMARSRVHAAGRAGAQLCIVAHAGAS